MAEVIEMGDLKPDEKAEETNFMDDNDSNNPIDDKNAAKPFRFNPNIPNVGKDVGVMRRAFTRDKKNFLKEVFQKNFEKGDGPNSTILFDN